MDIVLEEIDEKESGRVIAIDGKTVFSAADGGREFIFIYKEAQFRVTEETPFRQAFLGRCLYQIRSLADARQAVGSVTRKKYGTLEFHLTWGERRLDTEVRLMRLFLSAYHTFEVGATQYHYETAEEPPPPGDNAARQPAEQGVMKKMLHTLKKMLAQEKKQMRLLNRETIDEIDVFIGCLMFWQLNEFRKPDSPPGDD